MLQTLSNRYRHDADDVYKRYYRSYIRAFNDAKDAAPPRDHSQSSKGGGAKGGGAKGVLKKNPPDDDDYVTRAEVGPADCTRRLRSDADTDASFPRD